MDRGKVPDCALESAQKETETGSDAERRWYMLRQLALEVAILVLGAVLTALMDKL